MQSICSVVKLAQTNGFIPMPQTRALTEKKRPYGSSSQAFFNRAVRAKVQILPPGTNDGNYTMRLTCSQCEKEIGENQPVTVIRDESLSLFCDITCRNKWLFFDAIDRWVEDATETFDPKAFTSNQQAKLVP